MLSKWFYSHETFFDDEGNNILPEHMRYYFSAFNGKNLFQRDLYAANELTDFVHETALASEHLGDIAEQIFQLIESNQHLCEIIKQADYEHPLRERLQTGGLYNHAAVTRVAAAFRAVDLLETIASFTHNDILADEMLVVLRNIQRIFEFAECEKKIVISYLA